MKYYIYIYIYKKLLHLDQINVEVDIYKQESSDLRPNKRKVAIYKLEVTGLGPNKHRSEIHKFKGMKKRCVRDLMCLCQYQSTAVLRFSLVWKF